MKHEVGKREGKGKRETLIVQREGYLLFSFREGHDFLFYFLSGRSQDYVNEEVAKKIYCSQGPYNLEPEKKTLDIHCDLHAAKS